MEEEEVETIKSWYQPTIEMAAANSGATRKFTACFSSL